MKALSISQPWSWLIVNGFKDIENRDWTTDYRGLILIHAPKKVDPNAFYASGRFGAYPSEVETIDASFLDEMPLRDAYECGGIVGYATLQKVVTSHTSPWFRGKYGFVLTQRHAIDFIPLRGQRYLFDVPKEVEQKIDEIRERRFHEAESREQTQIAKEWYDYRHEGDETPDTRSWEERIP